MSQKRLRLSAIILALDPCLSRVRADIRPVLPKCFLVKTDVTPSLSRSAQMSFAVTYEVKRDPSTDHPTELST